MKYYTSYEKNTHQTPKEKKQEYWKTAIGLQQVDQLKPSNYLLELSQKNIEENLSNQEIEKLLYSHYTNESKEEEIERKMECDIVANRIVQLLQDDSFTFSPAALKSIHRYLFHGIYDFAGKIRTVNLSKGNFRFAPLMYLETAIKNVDKMPQNTFDEIVEKYVEMNIVHPFREGNGRSMRIWLDMMLKKQIGQVVDWSKIEKEDYLMAMERSPIKDIEIKYILNAALTDQINDREIYMKGIDHSYYYEGYVTYKTEEL